jgi:nucleoside-diphosphate-sugar epimerase
MADRSPRPVAALTGATGFLGAHLVRALSDAGFSVRVLARREPSPPGWGEVQPHIVAGDLSDPAALAKLVEGAAVVVHAAGAIKAADLTGFMAVNRDGTERLARACPSDAAFILVSSLAARSPELSAYAASKRAGEIVAIDVLGERVTIVRPPAIYGPGDRETLAIFDAAAKSPILPGLARIGNAAGLLSAEKAGEVLHKDWAIRPADRPPGAPETRWGLTDGFAATVNWYREAGWLR